MLNATRDLVLPTTITGSYPRPRWFTEELRGRLILSTDCGFGREGLARRIAFDKAVAINLGANIVRRELKLPEVEIAAADPRWTFAG
jgi:methionine synthase II (cobalamin-independent)